MKNKAIHLKYSLATILFIVQGCLTEISLEAPGTDAQNLAITASLLKGVPSSIIVGVARVANFVEFDRPAPINDAIVLLLNEDGEQISLPLAISGQYALNIPEDQPGFSIDIGKAYQIQVITSDGKRYLSTFERLYPVPKPIGMSMELEKRQAINETGNIVDQRFVRFFIDTPITHPELSGKAILKWDMTGTYKFVESGIDSPNIPTVKTCYVNEVLQRERPVVFNGKESGKSSLSQHFIIEEPLDHRFSRGFYLTAYQQSITEGAFEYWERIRKVVDISGNFFEAPPGKIKGNFRNIEDEKEEVFGYFYVAQQDTIRFYVPPNSFEEPVLPLCPAIVAIGQEPPVSSCFACQRIPNSSTQKPYFWIE